jgi:hypothetical protein
MLALKSRITTAILRSMKPFTKMALSRCQVLPARLVQLVAVTLKNGRGFSYG